MLRTILTLTILGSMALTAVSCSEIDEDEREEEVPAQNPTPPRELPDFHR